jgi:DNA adenine methylase
MTSHELSPLRYPGGKGALAPFLGRIIESQRPRCTVYVEPFAGGAGAAVRLLFDEFVDEIVLNDLDPGIAAFWRCVFLHTNDLARLIETAPISVEAWERHRNVYKQRSTYNDELDLGFSTFFLNRTNRSGILDARPIGGLGQSGTWKIDARFNRRALATRVRTLGQYRNRVTVEEQDGVIVTGKYLSSRHLLYADPPYLVRGSDLYLDTLTWDDHERLASVLSGSRERWMVTYDHDPRVRDLYAGFRCAEFELAHTAARQHVGREYAVFSTTLAIDSLLGLGRSGAFVA